MWWETIPPSLVIMAALTVGLYNSAGLHLLMFGVPYRRDLTTCFQRRMYVRDARISGSPYLPLGLDSLPDEPQKF